ncbi:hypothetical protein MCW82_19635 [Azospirillum doebereinerae]|uniref:hypothetical protein n=1 Tax=Azospirillum doebereinerae TaxID=92933 RepID=UPI001EE628B2|nr:hypothetical protein [Azospirillum doebereinerae]MCG5241993.1 hypothetical protein [Azospirillum doebereinerae]
MPTTHRLFAEAWLADLSADTPRDRALDAARSGIDVALARIDAALAEWRAHAEALGATGDPAHIAPLLRAETDGFPQAAGAADGAVHDVMRRVAFKRRELMPLFPPLLDRIRVAHGEAALHCGAARWRLMAARTLADPGGPSSPVQGYGTRYVKSDRFDARALQSLSAADRVRADRALKRLGESPIPEELDLRPLDGGLWTIKAGGRNRFILRTASDRRGALYVVEDAGLWSGTEDL